MAKLEEIQIGSEVYEIGSSVEIDNNLDPASASGEKVAGAKGVAVKLAEKQNKLSTYAESLEDAELRLSDLIVKGIQMGSIMTRDGDSFTEYTQDEDSISYKPFLLRKGESVVSTRINNLSYVDFVTVSILDDYTGEYGVRYPTRPKMLDGGANRTFTADKDVWLAVHYTNGYNELSSITIKRTAAKIESSQFTHNGSKVLTELDAKGFATKDELEVLDSSNENFVVGGTLFCEGAISEDGETLNLDNSSVVTDEEGDEILILK